MTEIKTACPIHGDVDVTHEDVVLRLSPQGHTYTFTCPHNHGVTNIASPFVAKLLRSAGVHMIDLTRPPAEALEPKAGPPIDLDYLIGFSLELKAAHPELMRILCEEESR